ncbi:MAG: hypothetical protein ABDH91_02030 [Bacteroidia bacterium]
MRARWWPAHEVEALWAEKGSAGEPFATLSWWQREPHWGGLVIEEGSRPIALLPLHWRRVAFFRFYRQPLPLPWTPIILWSPLPQRPDRQIRLWARVLGAIAEWIRRERLAYFSLTLPPQGCYEPAWAQRRLALYATGSFVLPPGAFAPSAELQRKARQAATFPFQRMNLEVALALWEAYRPSGVPSAMVQAIRRHLTPDYWRAYAVGEPPLALGLFMWGREWVWYIASMYRAPSQATTRLLYEVIQIAHEEGRLFDFWGSVLPGVERFFQQFGGRWEVRCRVQAWRLW